MAPSNSQSLMASIAQMWDSRTLLATPVGNERKSCDSGAEVLDYADAQRQVRRRRSNVAVSAGRVATYVSIAAYQAHIRDRTNVEPAEGFERSIC
jgi:hypothetical protein